MTASKLTYAYECVKQSSSSSFSERENTGFYTTRFGKRSIRQQQPQPQPNDYYIEDAVSEMFRQRKRSNKDNSNKHVINQEVAEYAVEDNEDYSDNDDLVKEDEEYVSTSPLGRSPSVQPRNIEGM